MAKDVPRYRLATTLDMVVVRMECLQPLVRRTKVVPNHTARKRCSVVVLMELSLLRATTSKDARNLATKQNLDVVRITRLQLAERIISDAAMSLNLVVVLMELSPLLDQMKKVAKRKLLLSHLSQKSMKQLQYRKIAQIPPTDVVRMVFRLLLAQTSQDAVL